MSLKKIVHGLKNNYQTFITTEIPLAYLVKKNLLLNSHSRKTCFYGGGMEFDSCARRVMSYQNDHTIKSHRPFISL